MASPTTQSVRESVVKVTETVHCRVYLSSEQANLTSNSWQKVLLNTVDYDNGTNFDTANNKFIVPVTGLYRVQAVVEFNDLIADRENRVAIYVEGASVAESAKHSRITGNLSVEVIDEMYLQALDEIEVYAKPDVGGSANSVDVTNGITATRLNVRLVTKEGIRQ